MERAQVKKLFGYLEAIEHLLNDLPKQACIIIPAQKGMPYKYEEICIYAIVSFPELYKQNGDYILKLELSNGTSREVTSPKKEYLQVLHNDIKEWRNLA